MKERLERQTCMIIMVKVGTHFYQLCSCLHYFEIIFITVENVPILRFHQVLPQFDSYNIRQKLGHTNLFVFSLF